MFQITLTGTVLDLYGEQTLIYKYRAALFDLNYKEKLICSRIHQTPFRGLKMLIIKEDWTTRTDACKFEIVFIVPSSRFPQMKASFM